MKKVISATLFVVGFAMLASAANAAEFCKPYDQVQGMSKEAIPHKVVGRGNEVRKVQFEDGCWQLKGTKDGNRVEAYFDHVTAELVLTK